MEIGIELDADGYLGDRYAKHADAPHLYAGTPTCSFPFELTGIPAGTASIALAFYDLDSIPVCGFAWVHWTAACIDAGLAEGGQLRFVENASNLGALGMVQGRNSSAGRMAGGSEDPLLCCRYNGPQPPDCDHEYTLRAWALDYMPELAEGFWANELVWATRGHVLAEAGVDIPARV